MVKSFIKPVRPAGQEYQGDRVGKKNSKALGEAEQQIEARLVAAFKTMAALPDPEARFLQGMQATWPSDVKRLEWGDVRPDRVYKPEIGEFVDLWPEPAPSAPATSEIDQMNEAMEWLFYIWPLERQQITRAAVAFKSYSSYGMWSRVGKKVGSNASRQTLWRQYSVGLQIIAERLKRTGIKP